MEKKELKNTIAEIARDYIIEIGEDGVMFGDSVMLDEIASRATHTNLMKLHPLKRHSRILTYLEKSGLFEKSYVRVTGMRGNPLWRVLKLKEDERRFKERIGK